MEVLGSCFMFHLDYGQKLLLGDTIRKDKLFCTRISRSFSGVVVCAWLLVFRSSRSWYGMDILDEGQLHALEA